MITGEQSSFITSRYLVPMRKIRFQAILLVFMFSTSLVHAEPVDWLYDVKVPVNARTQTEAETALQRSIEILLMRLTGLASIPGVPEVQTALTNLNTYVKQYEFTKLPPNSPYGEGDALVAKFNSTLIRELIKQAKFPVWPADRPSVLLWLTIHEGSDSELVRDGVPIALELRKRAKERGIELVVPIMDVQEQSMITSSSVNGRFWHDLSVASARYKTEFIAAVSCQKDFFGRFQTFITHWYQGAENFDHSVFRAREELPVNVIDHLVDVLVRQHAIVRDQDEIFRIGIADVSDVKSYAALLKHLSDLDFVDDFVLVSLDNEVFIFDVYTPSSAELFVELVAAFGLLQTVDSPERVIDKNILQLFSWVNPP